jgi:hypothetical protein
MKEILKSECYFREREMILSCFYIIYISMTLVLARLVGVSFE